MKKDLQSLRLGRVIENDRLMISAEISSLIEYDLKNLLENYFNLTGKVTMQVTAMKDCYLITVSAPASAVKPFGIIK